MYASLVLVFALLQLGNYSGVHVQCQEATAGASTQTPAVSTSDLYKVAEELSDLKQSISLLVREQADHRHAVERNITDIQRELENIKENHLRSLEQKEDLEALRSERDHGRIEEELNNINSEPIAKLEAVEKTLEKVKNKQVKIREDIKALTDQGKELIINVQDVQRKMAVVYENSEEIKTWQQNLKEDSEVLQSECKQIAQKIEKMEQETNTSYDYLEKLERGQVGIENSLQALRNRSEYRARIVETDIANIKEQLARLREKSHTSFTGLNKSLGNLENGQLILKRDLIDALKNATAIENYEQQSREGDIKACLESFQNKSEQSLSDVKQSLQTLQSYAQSTFSELELIGGATAQHMTQTQEDQEDWQTRLQDLQQNISQKVHDLQQQLSMIMNQEGDTEDKYVFLSVQYLPTSCNEIAKLNPNNPSGYYQLSDQNGITRLTYCSNGINDSNACDNNEDSQNSDDSCAELIARNPLTPSGYYRLSTSNELVYCHNIEDYPDPENPPDSCSEISTLNSSTPSGYYPVKVSNESITTVYCHNEMDYPDPDNLPESCLEVFTILGSSSPSGYYQLNKTDSSTTTTTEYCYNILSYPNPNQPPQNCSELDPENLSGYYQLQNSSGDVAEVYCDTRRSCCGSTGKWMRVASLNMRDPTHQCPEGFVLFTEPRRCSQGTNHRGCKSIIFPTHGIQYQQVCGRIIGYQKGTPDAFGVYQQAHSIEDVYVHGVSITHGAPPNTQHIWTFAAAHDEIHNRFTCPCSKNSGSTGNPPSFIDSNHYFCDSGSRSTFPGFDLKADDPLWDGKGCGPNSSCCTFNSPPWFCRQDLPQPTTDDIKLRVCRDESYRNEDVQIEIIDIFVR